MTTRFKKISLWYSIFILTLVLNQSNAARKDNVVITVIYGLWILLVAITWIYFKEGGGNDVWFGRDLLRRRGLLYDSRWTL